MTKITLDLDFLNELGGPGSGNHGHEGRPGKVGGSQPDDGVKIRDTKGIQKVGKTVSKNGNAYFVIDDDIYFCPLGHPYAVIELEDQKIVRRINGVDRQTAAIDQLDAIRVKYHYDAIIFETRSLDDEYLETIQDLISSGDFDTNGINDIQWGSVHQRDVQKEASIDYFLDIEYASELSLDELGGPGSGNHGHKGRPGKVGGSDDDGVPNASQSVGQVQYVRRAFDEEMIERIASEDFSKWEKSLSTDEKAAIKDYGFEAYGRINEKLRYNKKSSEARYNKEITAQIKAIDKALKKSDGFSETTAVYRGVDYDPDFSVGDSFIDKGFVSTSLSADVAAEDFASTMSGTMFSINYPRGANCGYISNIVGNKSEMEVLLPRNIEFRVTKISGHRLAGGGAVRVYHLDVVSGSDLSELNLLTIITSLNNFVKELGGPGSGNHGHAGRPGKVGGSAKSGSSRTIISDDATQEDIDWLNGVKKRKVIKDETKAEIAEILEVSYNKIYDMDAIEDEEEGSYSVMITDDESREPLIVTAVTKKGDEFTVGKRKFTTGGHYDPTAGDARQIMIFNADELDSSSLSFILHHEIQHDRFQHYEDELNIQKSEIFLQEQKGKNITDDDGNIISLKDKKKYWAYDINQTYIQGELSEVLAGNDGVSPYSTAYWEKWEQEGGELFGSDFEMAVNETLAEINRMYAGQLREGDKAPIFVDPVWISLYKDINRAGKKR